ncbi:MAG: hypothetical protein AAGB15_11790 [Pseudomonadota bacterium]
MRPTLTLLIALMIAPATLTQAGPRLSGESTAAEQNLLLRAEWERARLIGGYEDPITALRNLFNGTPTKRTIQPRLNAFGNETIEAYRAQIREALVDQN